MASYYLGPEIPKPFSCISETYQQLLDIPNYPYEDQYRFGDVYEESMFSLVHTHLELGTIDRFCYVGEDKGSFGPLIERKFCLAYPAKCVSPGVKQIPNQETRGLKTITYGPVSSDAEEFFKNTASQCSTYGKSMFDRLLIKDCIHMLSGNLYNLFSQMKAVLNPEGRLLIVHRPGMLNTLPLPRDMVKTFEAKDIDIGPILNALQDAGFDVKWDIEMLPVVMPKVKWLSMIQEKHPADLESADDHSIRCAIRELTEGMFKYEGDMVQFTDRLLFISASPALRAHAPSLTRYGSSGYREPPALTEDELKYEMPINREIQEILNKKARVPRANIGRTKAKWD